MVRPLGLVIASFLSILAAAGATPDARLVETLVLGRGADRILLPAVPGRPQSAIAVVAELLGSGAIFNSLLSFR